MNDLIKENGCINKSNHLITDLKKKPYFKDFFEGKETQDFKRFEELLNDTSKKY